MKNVDFLGLPLRAFTRMDFVDWIVARAKGPELCTAYAINAHSVNIAFSRRDYWNALQRSDVVYCDGISVLLGCRLLGTPLPEKLTTTDCVGPISERCEKEGISIYILGNAPGVAKRAAESLKRRYPDLIIKGTRSGYFTPEQEPAIIAEIAALKPQLLWVGLGNPDQELWVERHRHQLKVPVCLTCGGMMDILSGQLTRPPRWVTDNGLEWAYRLVTHPRYTGRRYLIGNIAFLYRFARYWLRGPARSPQTVGR